MVFRLGAGVPLKVSEHGCAFDPHKDQEQDGQGEKGRESKSLQSQRKRSADSTDEDSHEQR